VHDGEIYIERVNAPFLATVKHHDRPYQGGRSKHWIKIKNREHPAMARVMDAWA
jgi:hypothetical protein